MGKPGAQADVARAVKRVAGSLLRVAEDHVIEFLGIDSRSARSRPCAATAPSSWAVKSFSLPQ